MQTMEIGKALLTAAVALMGGVAYVWLVRVRASKRLNAAVNAYVRRHPTRKISGIPFSGDRERVRAAQ
jgi:hypothetical protein